MGVNDVSGADYCCWSRPPRDLEVLSERQVTYLLKMNQNAVLTIVCVQFVVLWLWTLAGMIPGFVLYDGAAGTFSAYTHGGFWFGIEFTTFAVGAVATYFGLNYSTTTRVIEKGVHRVVEWDTFYMVVLFINWLANLAHGSLTIVELATCASNQSTLCVSYHWALITLLAFVVFLAFLSLIQMLRVQVFKNNLCAALAAGKIDTTLSFKQTTQDDDDDDDMVVVVQPPPSANDDDMLDEDVPPYGVAPRGGSNGNDNDGPAPSSPPQDALQRKMRLQTPLLAQLANGSSRHGFKEKKKN
jgi:hypothetical protein